MPLDVQYSADNTQIYSHVRKRWVSNTPEEVIRQRFVCDLVNKLGLSPDQMAEEWNVGPEDDRADLAIWGSVRERQRADKQNGPFPRIIVEFKANSNNAEALYNQAARYALLARAPYYITHTNEETRCWTFARTVDGLPGGRAAVDAGTVFRAVGVPRWKAARLNWKAARSDKKLLARKPAGRGRRTRWIVALAASTLAAAVLLLADTPNLLKPLDSFLRKEVVSRQAPQAAGSDAAHPAQTDPAQTAVQAVKGSDALLQRFPAPPLPSERAARETAASRGKAAEPEAGMPPPTATLILPAEQTRDTNRF